MMIMKSSFLVEETGVPGGNHRPTVCTRKLTLSLCAAERLMRPTQYCVPNKNLRWFPLFAHQTISMGHPHIHHLLVHSLGKRTGGGTGGIHHLLSTVWVRGRWRNGGGIHHLLVHSLGKRTVAERGGGYTTYWSTVW